jgi:hypothetical protein
MNSAKDERSLSLREFTRQLGHSPIVGNKDPEYVTSGIYAAWRSVDDCRDTDSHQVSEKDLFNGNSS